MNKTVGIDFTYDNSGQLLNTGVESTIAGRMTKLSPKKGGGKSITIPKKNGTIKPTTVSDRDSVYFYDADGIRTTKYTYNEDLKETVVSDEAFIEGIVNDENNEILLIDSLKADVFPNAVETQYFYLGDSILFTADLNGYKLTENVLDPWGNTVVSKRYEEIVEKNSHDEEVIVGWDVYYFTLNTDIRGSVTNIIRPNGTLTTGYVYDEFGNQIKTGEEDFLNEATYTGAIFDSETGLTYMNARYYDSTSGRFISQDSYGGLLSNPQTQHLYSYTSNNPINFIDPTGYKALSVNDDDDYYKKTTYIPKVDEIKNKEITESILNPFTAARILAMTKSAAQNFANETYPDEFGTDSTKANAAQHVFWSAYTFFYTGESAAKIINAHEYGDDSNASYMDRINNAIGYKIGGLYKEEFSKYGNIAGIQSRFGATNYKEYNFKFEGISVKVNYVNPEKDIARIVKKVVDNNIGICILYSKKTKIWKTGCE